MMKRVTIEDVIATVDEMYPNTYDRKDKERWIKELEKRIEIEIMSIHESPQEVEENKLYAPEPYADIYVHYLELQMDKSNGEYDRYSNHMALFENMYHDFAVYYNRTHMPVDNGRVKL